jgi:hypothetical protein
MRIRKEIRKKEIKRKEKMGKLVLGRIPPISANVPISALWPTYLTACTGADKWAPMARLTGALALGLHH